MSSSKAEPYSTTFRCLGDIADKLDRLAELWGCSQNGALVRLVREVELPAASGSDPRHGLRKVRLTWRTEPRELAPGSSATLRLHQPWVAHVLHVVPVPSEGIAATQVCLAGIPRGSVFHFDADAPDPLANMLPGQSVSLLVQNTRSELTAVQMEITADVFEPRWDSVTQEHLQRIAEASVRSASAASAVYTDGVWYLNLHLGETAPLVLPTAVAEAFTHFTSGFIRKRNR